MQHTGISRPHSTTPFNANQDDDKSTSYTSHATHAASQVQLPIMTIEPEWKKRLKIFVVSFVTETEKTLELYQKILEDRNTDAQDSGSVAKELSKGLGGAVGGILSYFFTLPGGIASIASDACALGGGKLGDVMHKNKLKSLSDLVYYYKENKEAQRKILIEAGIQIFRSFEMQIVGFEGDTAPQTYVHIFSVDAVHRVIKFCSKEGIGKFTVDVVTKGVIKGISKKRKPQILMKRGLEVMYKGKTVTTSDIFTEVDLLDPRNGHYYIKEGNECNGNMFSWKLDSMNDYSYIMKEEESRVSRPCCRILFNWELAYMDGIDKDYTNNYVKQRNPPKSMYKHVLNKENCSEILNELIDLICPKDTLRSEDTMKQDLQDLKFEILEEIKEKLIELDPGPVTDELTQVKKLITELKVEEYASKLQIILEEKYQKIQEAVEKESDRTRYHITSQHEETRTSVRKDAAERDDVMLRKMQEELNRTRLLLSEEMAKMQTGDETEQIRKPVTLDFRKHVESFSGRVEDLQELKRFLNIEDGKRPVVVCGLGGVGKSELVRRYAAENASVYDNNIVWINAECYESMSNSFLRLASKLSVATEERHNEKSVKLDIKDVVISIYDKLGAKCLFVFDDVQKCRNENKAGEDLKTFLPDGVVRKPHVIITSCLAAWDSSISKINLKIFEEKETLELLEKLLGNEFGENEMKDFGELLGHLPLALQIAAAYIKDQGITIKTFIDEFTQKNEDILKLGFPDCSMDNSTKTIFTTFQVILEKLPGKAEAGTKTVLSCLAYFNPTNIPRDLFSDLGEDTKKIRSVIMSLKKSSVITSHNKNKEILQMHKLVQYIIRMSLEDTENVVLEKVLRLLKSKLDRDPKDSVVKQADDIWIYAGNYEDLIERYYSILKFPLHRAVQLRRMKMVECLLNNVGIDIYAEDRHGFTALYRANQQGDNMEIVEYLILNSPRHRHTKNPEDWKTLGKAAKENRKEILKFLINESYAKQDLDKGIILRISAQKGRLDVLRYLLNNGTSIQFQKEGVTVLHEAAYSDDSSIIEYVLVHVRKQFNNTAQVDMYINAKDESGDTALMWAAKSWKRNAVKTLLRYKADVTAQNNDGLTALKLAEQTAEVRGNCEEFLSLLR